MAIQEFSNLRTRAQEIKNETEDEANTQVRVGSLHEDTVDTIEEEINAIAEPQPGQIEENAQGFYEIRSIYKIPDNSVIDFRTSGQRLNPADPIYDTFTFAEDFTWANVLNKWDVLFSCEAVPSIISSPPSFLDITGTILTGYANLNRITFLLDQVYNATTDEYELKVICNIIQAEGANTDPAPPSGGDSTLVGHWKGEETSDFNTILDSSGYGHHATVVDSGQTISSRVSGIVGDAIQMNSSNSGSRFEVTDNTDINVAGNTPITFITWIYINASDIGSNTVRGVFQKGGFRLTKQGAVTPVDSFDLRINGVSTDRVRTGTIPADTWLFLAGRFNGTTNLDIWLNTTKTSNTITSTELVDVATSLQVCGISTNSLGSGNRMDEPRFWKRALTDQEIEDIFTAENPI